MKYLMIVETNITNPSWVQEYLVKVTPLLSKFGGKYITRTSNIELLEGDHKPQYTLVAEFSSKENALDFYQSSDYAPYKDSRKNRSSSNFLFLPIENATA